MTRKPFTIAVENSTWNNIGDAFYQMSLKQALKTALPGCEVFDMEGPINRAFRPRKQAGNALDIRGRFEADHYVFSGPILSRGFLDEYAPLIRELVGRGKTYSLLSVHAYAVGEDLAALREFFAQYPPAALHTRDTDTFRKLEGTASVELDGICFAFFVRFIEGVPALAREPEYICSSFHSQQEPSLDVLASGDLFEADVEGLLQLEGNPRWRYLRHLEWRKNFPSRLGTHEIVRPVHGFYPFPHLLFSRPNSFITYNPINFLAVYRGCRATVTDRVHAGVASLSYGNPAAVAALDGRFALFDHAPVKRRKGWMHLDEEALLERHNQHIEWLSGPFKQAVTGEK